MIKQHYYASLVWTYAESERLVYSWSPFPQNVSSFPPWFSGVFPISGVFDLGFLRRTSVNDALRLTAAEAEANSPTRLLLRKHENDVREVSGKTEYGEGSQ